MDETNYQYTRDPYMIDTDRRRLDLDIIHNFLSRSYWCAGIPKNVLRKAIANSLCFGLYIVDEQIGFARVVTDYARFAFLCDVFVLRAYRGQGLGKWLVECVLSCELLQGNRKISLGTRDAHGLYARFGFKVPENTERMMELKFQMPWSRPDLVID